MRSEAFCPGLHPGVAPQGDGYNSNRPASCSRCFCSSSGTTPPNESKYSLCAAVSFLPFLVIEAKEFVNGNMIDIELR